MGKQILSIILCMPVLMLSSCSPGDVCGPQMIIDCSNNCVDEFDVNDLPGDGTCDDNLNCSEFEHDGGDCDDNESTTTTTAETSGTTTTVCSSKDCITSTTTTSERTRTTTTTTADCRRRGCTTTIGERTSTTTTDCERIPRLCITTTTSPSDDDCTPYVMCTDSSVCYPEDPCTITCFEMPMGWSQTQSHADACEEFGWMKAFGDLACDVSGRRGCECQWQSCIDACEDRTIDPGYTCLP